MLCFKSIQFLNQYVITENIVSLFITLSPSVDDTFNGVYLCKIYKINYKRNCYAYIVYIIYIRLC